MTLIVLRDILVFISNNNNVTLILEQNGFRLKAKTGPCPEIPHCSVKLATSNYTAQKNFVFA